MTKEREKTSSLSRNSSVVELDSSNEGSKLGQENKIIGEDVNNTTQDKKPLVINKFTTSKQNNELLEAKIGISNPIDISNGKSFTQSSSSISAQVTNMKYKCSPKKEKDCEEIMRTSSYEDKLPPLKNRSNRSENRSCSLENNLHKQLDDDPELSHLRSDRRMAFLGLFSQSLLGYKRGKICPSTSLPQLCDSRSLEITDSGWIVPSIRALETLHNALTLKQVENLLTRVTQMQMKSPFSSPAHSHNSSLTKLADVVKNINAKEKKEGKSSKNVLTKHDIPEDVLREKTKKKRTSTVPSPVPPHFSAHSALSGSISMSPTQAPNANERSNIAISSSLSVVSVTCNPVEEPEDAGKTPPNPPSTTASTTSTDSPCAAATAALPSPGGQSELDSNASLKTKRNLNRSASE